MLCATACAHELLQPDLAAVARRDAVRATPAGRRMPSPSASSIASVASWPAREARLRLGRAGPRVLLQEPVRVLAPAGALADQRRPRPSLLRTIIALDERRERRRRAPPGRPRSARAPRSRGSPGSRPESAPIAPRDPHVVRARVPRISIGCSVPGYSGTTRCRSNVVSARDALDLELGHERPPGSPAASRDETDRPLGREEAEAREVLDVLVESDVAGQLARGCGRAGGAFPRLAASLLPSGSRLPARASASRARSGGRA